MPAIVDLLTHGWTPTPTAPIATLLDLAARGYIHLAAESSSQLICQLPSPVPSESLAPFEQQLLWHAVSRLSGDGTPPAALLPDPDDEDGKRWYAGFRSDVINEARRIGLVRGSGTDAGRAAASRWLGVRAALLTALRPPQLPVAGASFNDRMLGWAVALSAAPGVADALAPTGDDWVWSSAGGRWRQALIAKAEVQRARDYLATRQDPSSHSSSVQEEIKRVPIHNYYIQGGVAQLNSGDQQTVLNIQNNLEAVGAQGDTHLAMALKTLSEAALRDPDLDEVTKAGVLDAIEEVSDGARQPPTERRLPRIMRAVSYISTEDSAASAFRGAWEEYAPAITQYFDRLRC